MIISSALLSSGYCSLTRFGPNRHSLGILKKPIIPKTIIIEHVFNYFAKRRGCRKRPDPPLVFYVLAVQSKQRVLMRAIKLFEI
jgi:hypothetical protein